MTSELYAIQAYLDFLHMADLTYNRGAYIWDIYFWVYAAVVQVFFLCICWWRKCGNISLSGGGLVPNPPCERVTPEAT